MKTKRILWMLLGLLIVTALAVSACGTADEPVDTGMEEEPAEETVAEEAEEEEPAEEAEPVTVRVFAGNVGQELELTKAAAERYMAANPDVTVEVVDTPDFVEDRLGVYLQLFEAQSPEGDIFQIDVIWPGDLATHFVDLYEYGAAEVAGEHFPAIIENNTVDGALVGIPWFTDAGLLYYRTDLLEKYGYDSGPSTWEELEEMAATIQEGEREDGNEDFWGYVWQGNAYEGLTCDALEWVYSNGGGTIVSPDKVITVNNPAAIAAVEMAADWVGTISPPGVTGFGEEDARGVWQAGNAAFMRNWPYAYSLGQADESAIKDLFDVSPLPAGDAGRSAATLGGWQLAVSKYSENPEVAADVAMFMASADEQKIRATEGSFNPTVMSLYEDADVLEATPFFGSLYDVFINAVARPSTATAPNYAETSRIFFSGVHDVLTGATDAATAFEVMELDMADLLGYEVSNLGSADNPIQVLFVPSVDTDFMISSGELIEDALTEATNGFAFEVSVPTSYAATLEEMCAASDSSMGFIPAFGYVLANQLCGVEPALAAERFGWNVYWAQFIALRDSGIESLEDLEGKTWAYPDATSTSGFLFPSALFEEMGLTIGEATEAGGHTAVVKAIYNGEADFGTTYFSPPLLPEGRWQIGDAPEPYLDQLEDCGPDEDGDMYCGGFRVLDARTTISTDAPDVIQKVGIVGLTSEIPNDTMSYSPDFPEWLRQLITNSVSEYIGSEACEDTICNENFYDWTAAGPISDENFDSVRLLVESQGITLENIGE
jgi:trehalose/maltose transport system substrate-binding protein